MFDNILTYQSSTGLLVPDTSNVRSDVIATMKQIFGADFEYVAETPNGIFVDALTKLIKDVVGVTAQNVNGLNVRTAMGAWLDALADLFGISRAEGESDTSLRARILQSYAIGPGFVPSVYNAIYRAVPDIGNVCVLENGKAEPMVVPDNECGIAIDAHSVLIVANSADKNKVGEAIDRSLSAGCGFHDLQGHGTKNEYESDIRTVSYYVPDERYVKVVMTVNPIAYNGTDISADTASAIRTAVDGKTICAITTKSDFEFAVASAGKSIIPVDTKIYVRDTVDGSWTEQEKLVVMPYQFVDPANITVEVVQK